MLCAGQWGNVSPGAFPWQSSFQGVSVFPRGMAGSRQTENTCLAAPKLLIMLRVWEPMSFPSWIQGEFGLCISPFLLGKYLRSFSKASQWGFGIEIRHCESLCWARRIGQKMLDLQGSQCLPVQQHSERAVAGLPWIPHSAKDGGMVPYPSPSLWGSHCPWQVKEGGWERSSVSSPSMGLPGLLQWQRAALPELFAFCQSPSLKAVNWLCPSCFPVLWAGRTEPEQWLEGSTHGFSSSLINRI